MYPGLKKLRHGFWGPPINPAHLREWTFKEFRQYVSQHFDIVDHRITNAAQWTQMIIFKNKADAGNRLELAEPQKTNER